MRPAGEREFLSCDWGTSHFRLKWIVGGEVVAQVNNENGCKKLHQASVAGGSAERVKVFEKQLQLAVEELFALGERKPAEPICLLISGMASSTIGWKELPYGRAPIPLDGSGLKIDLLAWDGPSLLGKTFLVSGVATKTNMMRGEETEAIGLLSSMSERVTDLVLLLPGTHSKHLRIQAGMLQEIRTFMTGELYAVLSRESILSASVAPGARFSEEGFSSGVEIAQKEGLAAGLFHTRSRQVLGGRPAAENAAFLSGLLIGSEMKDLLAADDPEILVGGAPELRGLYARALTHLGCQKWQAFSDVECENAVARGHGIILSQLLARNL
jgi:2-dehydro-3-deoxygalactonokinase